MPYVRVTHLRPLRALVLVLAAALLPACAKSPRESAASPGGYGGEMEVSESDADAGYDRGDMRKRAMDDSYSPPEAPEPAPSPSATSSSPRGGLAGGAAPPANSKTEAPPPPPSVKPGDPADTSQSEPQKPVLRQLIYIAELHLSVFKKDDAMKQIEALALDTGGYIQSMSEGYYVLRIPAPRLRGLMSSVGNLGMVTHRSLDARDVTEEYVDLNSRIRVLRDTQAQLLDLLKKARTVDEALHVRQALDRVTMELEQALGRLRMLESLIGYSTLTVRVEERGPVNNIPSSNDPFPWVDSLGVEATEWR